MRRKTMVQMIQHNPGLHAYLLHVRVEFDHTIKMRAGVDDECLADRLTALRGPAAAGKYRDLLIGGNLNR